MPRPFVKAVALSGAVAASALFAFSANAVQTVDPFTAPSGGTNLHGTTIQKNVSQPVVFYGIYSDNSAGAESGLGLKVAYDATKLTNVTITEEYTKCRIAAAQKQEDAPATSQVVMGWIDTAIRPNGVVASANGAVGWPDAADLTTGGCLNPGSINTDTAAASSTALKLFKFSATTAANFTGSTVVSLDAGQNYSYAGASPGFTQKSFTVQFNASIPTIALASANPYVSRKTHGAVTYDIPINPAGLTTGAPSESSVTVEPRVGSTANATTGHQIVVAFTGAAPTSVGSVVAQTQSAAPITSSVAYVGNEMIITLGSVPDGSRVSVTANAVNGVSGLNPSAVVCFLAGDVNSSWSTTGTDVNAVKSAAATSPTVTASNFRNDVNLTGGATGITGTDVNAVKAKAAASATCL